MAIQRKRRVTKRKQGKRVYRRKPRTMGLVNTALAPIPQRFITKMKFAADVSTNNAGLLTLNLNSIHDPLRTGGASPDQPYSHDTMATLYNRYRVISCGWRIQAPNSSGVIQVGCLPANDIYTPGLFADLRENPRARYFTQHPQGPTLMLKGKSYIPSLVGRTKAQYMADDRFQASFGSNPLEAAILNLAVASSNGVLFTSGQILNVLLEYTVELFDVKSLTPS